MRGLVARAERMAVERARMTADALVEAAAGELPADVSVAREGEAVVLSGRGLGVRSLRDARLRGLGWLLR